MIQQLLGFEWAFSGDKNVLAILSTFIFIYGGHPFFKGLYDEVKDNAIGMMTLIGVAITVVWAYSVPGEKTGGWYCDRRRKLYRREYAHGRR